MSAGRSISEPFFRIILSNATFKGEAECPLVRHNLDHVSYDFAALGRKTGGS